MKRIAWVFWGFLALLTGLWLMADTLLPAQRGYFDFRTVWVQYTGVIAMGVMSLAMAAGGAVDGGRCRHAAHCRPSPFG